MRKLHLRPLSLLVCLASLANGESVSAPYVPKSDEVVLEKSVGGADRGREKELRQHQAMLRASPGNLDVALRAAQAYIIRARESADPRFLSYAQAGLAPWWNADQPPVPVLVARATIRQSRHEFEPALADLRRALERDPRHVQAWLTRSTIEIVMGEPRAARESCNRLVPLTEPLIARTCLAAAESMLGSAAAAYATLAEALSSTRKVAPGIEAWSRSVLAEIADRLGKDAQAEQQYRQALALAPADTYTRAALADFLLDRGRAKEALELIRDVAADALLLRALLAARALGDPRAEAWTAQMAARFDASRARGDNTHLRDESRFELEVRGNGQRALALAVENWRTQKDLADARTLMEAAVAARKPEAARPALAYLSQFGTESVPLSRLRAQLQGT